MILAIALLGLGRAWAATTEPERIVNDAYHFAFICEANSLITFKKGVNGFTCFHQAQESSPAYALLVYGSGDLDVSTEAVKTAGLKGKAGNIAITTQQDLDKVELAEMRVAGYTNAGTADVTVPGGTKLAVPYATWSKRAGAKTHYALAYVVLHEHKFLNVQVESEQPLTSAQLDWLTTELELLPATTVPVPAPTPSTGKFPPQ
jgi:hypothetical protein